MILEIGEIEVKRRQNTSRYGGGISYQNVQFGFKPRERPYELANALAGAYWDVLMKRAVLRWRGTNIGKDIKEFARRLA